MELAIILAFIALCGCVWLGIWVFKLKNVQKAWDRQQIARQKDFQEFRALVDREVMILRTDPGGTVLQASQAFADFVGYETSELEGRSFRQILIPEALPEYYQDLWSSLAATFGWRDEFSSQKKSGQAFWAEVSVSPIRDYAGNLEGFHAVVHDVTSRKQVEVLSITDELTGLFNRRHFNQTFVREMVRARRAKDSIVFAMLDVDHFKLYNDNYGHQKGDEVLRSIGEAIRNILRRPTDFSFRMGGEEFGILLVGMPFEKAQAFLNVIRQVIMDLAIEHEYNEKFGVVTASFGAVHMCYPDPSREAEYFREADANLYIAKDGGRNTLVITSSCNES